MENRMNLYVFAKDAKAYRKYEKANKGLSDICRFIFVIDYETILDVYGEYYVFLKDHQKFAYYNEIEPYIEEFRSLNMDLTEMTTEAIPKEKIGCQTLTMGNVSIKIVASTHENIFHVILENTVNGNITYQILTKEHIKSMYNYEIQSNN